MLGIGEILSALNIVEKLGRFLSWGLGKRKRPQETVAGRFIRLFESHGVHRNQIPRFFGHGLTVQDVQSDGSLLPKLDEALLQAACDLFAVRREWLDGADTQVYACHDFYKHPENVAGFLDALKAANPGGDLHGDLLAPKQGEGEALIVLYETIGSVGDKVVYRYHLLNNWLFDYWKARAYLAACVAIAWKHNVFIRGVYLGGKVIAELAEGKRLVGENGGGLDSYPGRRWYPEDMSFKPDAFLKGVDAERGNFGIVSAIDLWLRLDEQGFMDANLEMYDRVMVRDQFRSVRREYVSESAHGVIS